MTSSIRTLPLALLLVGGLVYVFFWRGSFADPAPSAADGTPDDARATSARAATGGDEDDDRVAAITAELVEQRELKERARGLLAERNIEQNQTDMLLVPESKMFQIYHRRNMMRLGWAVDDPLGVQASLWYHAKHPVDKKLFDAVEDHGGAEQIDNMRAYNEHTDRQRQLLVQKIGFDKAQEVLDEFCIYKFDLAQRNWYRVDASGARVPFKHDDDDIWDRGEVSKRWSNHWRN